MRERDAEWDKIKQLEDTLDTRESELQALQAKVDHYSAEIGALRKHKTGEVEPLRLRLREMERQNANQDLRLASLKKEVEAQGEDYGQLNIAFAAKQQELDMARSPVLPYGCIANEQLVWTDETEIFRQGHRGHQHPRHSFAGQSTSYTKRVISLWSGIQAASFGRLQQDG